MLFSSQIFITGYILIWQHFLYLGEKTTIIWPWKRFLHTYFLCVIFFMKRIAVNCRRFLLHKTFLLLVTPKWRLGFPGFLFYNVQDFMGITKYKRAWYEMDFGGWNESWIVNILNIPWWYFMNLMNMILGKHFIIFFTAWRLLGSCILTVKVHIFFIAFNIKEHSTCFGYLIFHLSECSEELMLWKQHSNIVRLDLIVWGLCCFYNCTTFLLQYYGSLFWHLRHFSFL